MTDKPSSRHLIDRAENAGMTAAVNKVPYDQNPHAQGPADLKLAWSQGHNGMRARLATDADRIPEEIVEMERTMKKPNVLVVYIDTQGDFVFRRGVLPVAGAEAMVGALCAYLATLDPAEVAAFLASFDTHTPEDYIGSAENLGDEAAGIPGFKIHCEKGKPGWENVVNLRIPFLLGIPTYKIEKDVFDMFGKPGFVVEDLFGNDPVRQRDAFLQRLRANGVDTIRIAGFASDYCVNWAIQGFLAMGFKVEILEDLVAGIGKDIRQTAEDHFPGRVDFIRAFQA